MKKLIVLLPVFAVCMLFSGSAEAQDYKTAVGARLGYPLSASLKYVLNDNGSAIEAYVGTRGWGYGRYVSVSAAYQIHKPLDIEGLDGLYYYFGGGATIAFWNYADDFFFDDDYSTTAIGIQGYLGLDYAFEDTPINLTVDWIPTFFVNGYGNGFGGGYGSVGIRYILSR